MQGRRPICVVVCVLAAAPAFATERRFTYSYESAVLAPGMRELELWTTPRIGRADWYVRFDNRAELEFGVVDRLQSSVYLNFDTVSATGARLATLDGSVSNEWKWKLLDAVADPVGLALYGEWTLGFDTAELEAKIIADKRIGQLSLAANAIAEEEWESGGRDLVLTGTLGLAYLFTENLGVGLEGWSQSVFGGEGFEATAIFAGPTVSWASKRWWAALTFVPQVGAFKSRRVLNEEPLPTADVPREPLELNDHERFNIRLLMGFNVG